MTETSECELRIKACQWLQSHFPKRDYLLEPIVFHDIGMTVTNFLKRKFKGSQLTSIPKYNSLQIRPDLIAILLSSTDSSEIPLWIIGECKVGRITRGYFRQAKDYADTACSYEAYLFYDNDLSTEVIKAIENGGHIYNGTNRWGKPVRKKIEFVKYSNNKFTKQNY